MAIEYELTVDPDRCAGTGVCMVYASNTFEIGDDIKSHVIDPSGDTLEDIRLAVEGCPNQAIDLVKLMREDPKQK